MSRGFAYAAERGDTIILGHSDHPVRTVAELNAREPGRYRLLGFVASSEDQVAELRALAAVYEGTVQGFVAALSPYVPPRPVIAAGAAQ